MVIKKLSDDDKKRLLALEQSSLSISLISKLFGKTTKKEAGKFVIIPPEFDTRSPFHLNAKEYINQAPVDTTVGIFLFNKLMVEGMIENIVPNGYFNEVADAKGFGKLLDLISDGLMMQKIPIEPNLVKWLKHYEFYGMKTVTIFSPSYSEGILRSNIKIAKKKNELLKNREIKSTTDMTDIEDELVAYAKKELKYDSGMTLFNSGARGSFENDYKNMNLMLGPVSMPGEYGKFHMVTSNYIDGLQKKDIVAAGDSLVSAVYPKAVAVNNCKYLAA